MSRLPRSMRALLVCVAIEIAVYFVVLLTQSPQEPPNCDDYCWSHRDMAAGWGYVFVAPLVAGQLLFGGLAVRRAARKDDRGIAVGLSAFIVTTALMTALLFFIYWLQSS